MSAVDQLKKAATVLQEADVSDIVSSLALGIADAQEQLDNNSIKQTLALADPTNAINGKSLLELGFTPAFYHFQYADISASINLKMYLSTATSLGVGLEADFDRQGGISSENLNLFKKTRSEVHRDEFRSSRQFLMSASETRSVKIQKSTVKMNHQEGSVTKVQNFAQNLRDTQDIERVQTVIESDKVAVDRGSSEGIVVNNSGGYVTVRMPYTETDAWGILQIMTYPTNTSQGVDLDGAGQTSSFYIQNDFTKTWENATQPNILGNSGLAMGFTQGGIYLNQQTGLATMQLHFRHDHKETDFGYHTNSQWEKAFMRLAEILRLNKTAKVKVVGHTDSSGSEKYNELLSENRAKWIQGEFVKQGALEAQVELEYKDEEEAVAAVGDGVKDVQYRKVTIQLVSDADFIVFSGGNMTSAAKPNKVNTAGNGFIKIQADMPDGQAKFSIGNENYDIAVKDNSHDSFKSEFEKDTRLSNNFSREVVNNVTHLLSNEATIKHIVYSNETEDINIASDDSSSSSTSSGENTIKVDSNQNSLTRIQKVSNTIDNPNTFAVGGTVDFRTSRAFDVSAEGSSSVSARLVSLPAPPEFLDEIKAFLN